VSRVTEEQMDMVEACKHEWVTGTWRRECRYCGIGELIMDMDTAKSKGEKRIAELERQAAMKHPFTTAEFRRLEGRIAELEQQLADLRIHASHYKAAEDKDKPIIAEVMVSELIG